MRSISRRGFVKRVSGSVAAATVGSRWARGETAARPGDMTLWFDTPAAQWVDALPIGNGRLGAMVFGGANEELLQLNDATLWSGKPHDGNNKEAKNYLGDVRRAVLEQQDYHLADAICRKMQGKHVEAYMPLGGLKIGLSHEGEVKGYRRELDLDAACARVSYRVGMVRFEREMFSSAPDQVLGLSVQLAPP